MLRLISPAQRRTGCRRSRAESIPKGGRSLRQSDPATRLVFAGDPRRGIPPCAACHGPGGFKLGAPPLHGQHAAYIERQLGAFAQGIRQNDIYEQMRAIAEAADAGRNARARRILRHARQRRNSGGPYVAVTRAMVACVRA